MSVNNKEFVTVRTATMIATLRCKSYIDDCEKYGTKGEIAGEPVFFFTPKAHRILRAKWQEHDAKMGLGDVLHTVFGRIGRFIHWPCNKRVDGKVTNDLQEGSPCDRMRTQLNKVKMP